MLITSYIVCENEIKLYLTMSNSCCVYIQGLEEELMTKTKGWHFQFNCRIRKSKENNDFLLKEQ